MVIFQKNKNRITKWSSNSTSGCIPKQARTLSDICTHVHSSIIHNSQKVAATQVSINRQMNKQNILFCVYVYTYVARQTDRHIHIVDPCKLRGYGHGP